MVHTIYPHPAPGCCWSPPYLVISKIQFQGVFRPFIQRSLTKSQCSVIVILNFFGMLLDLSQYMSFKINGQKIQRSIFQTFWKPDSCPDFLFFQIESKQFFFSINQLFLNFLTIYFFAQSTMEKIYLYKHVLLKGVGMEQNRLLVFVNMKQVKKNKKIQY